MKNLPESIKNELKALKNNITPDFDWKKKSEQSLLSQLNIEKHSNQKHTLLIKDLFSSFFHNRLSAFSFRSVGVLVLVIAVVVGPGLATVNAARASLPGDRLYSIKRSLERADVNTTFTKKKKVKKEMVLVSNRLNELHRITTEQIVSPERDEKLSIVIEELKKDTASVKIRLESVKEASGVQDSDVLDLAKDIEEKTIEYKEALNASVAGMDGENAVNASQDIEQALIVVQDVALDALGILVENHEEDGEDVSEEETDELNGKIKNQIDATKEIIENLTDRVSDEPLEEVDEVSTDEDLPEEGSSEGLESEEDLLATEKEEEQAVINEEMHTKLEGQLLDDIAYASELLEMDDFSEALDVLSETKVQVDELAAVILDDIVEVDPVEEGVVEDIVTDEPIEEPVEEGNQADEVVEEPEDSVVDEVTPEEAPVEE